MVQTLKLLSVVTLTIALCAIQLSAASADETPACQLAGVNDDGGYIDCGEYSGPARIVGVTPDQAGAQRVHLLVNDSQAVDAVVYRNPDATVFAVILYDAEGMLAYGMTRPAALPGGVEIPSDATASYGATLDLYAPCTYELDAGPHWCR